LAALATIWFCRSRMEIRLLVLLLAGITAIHLPFISFPRYRIPFEIVVFLLAGGAFQAWHCHRKAGSQAATGNEIAPPTLVQRGARTVLRLLHIGA